jgi:hypothetical protein
MLCSLPSAAESSPDLPAPAVVQQQPGQAREARDWTAKERWDHYLKENFLSPGAFFRAAGPALGQQMGDNPPEWGQGMSGYGKRLADQFAVRTIQGTIEYGAAAALDINPKYRPCDCRGFFPRFGYAVLSNAITYKTDGSRTFNAPNFAGIYGSSFTALAWYPDRYSYKDAFREGTQSLAFGGSFNIFREFWPEIRKIVPFARKK